MKRALRLQLSILLVLLAVAVITRDGQSRPRQELSRTSPPVNLTHVFEGEINRRGKPVGFHSRPGGKNPAGARVTRVVDGPNRLGVYVAEVEIRDGSRWLSKRSTFYPDRMNRDAVVQAILQAYKNRTTGNAENFRGPSGRGFTIQGWHHNGRINTAHPIYTGSSGRGR